jgi:5-methyltetrahydropteroyltriglutamate--homocysteine methyltransferase
MRSRSRAIAKNVLLPTTVAGNSPQPDWLVTRSYLRKRVPVRWRAREMWRIPAQWLEQAQNTYYADDESLAIDYAAAVNEEIKDLFAAGADVVQIDEPYMQPWPEKACKFAVRALNRALQGVGGTTAVHLCFGYAHYIKEKKEPGYAFLSELEGCKADQVSIEAAQPKLDLAVLKELPSKTIILGVLDLGNPEVERPETVASRIRAALEIVPPGRLVVAPDCGMKYLARNVAFAKLKTIGRGHAARARRIGFHLTRDNLAPPAA